MAKRIQMRKQRFMAIQKIAQEKKLQVEGAQQAQSMGSMSQGGGEHAHSHGHGHSHSHPHAPKQQVSSRSSGYSNIQQNVGSRGCSIVGPLFQEVRFKVHDPKAHSKGGTLENTINGGRGRGNPDNVPDEESGGDIRPPPPPHLIHPGKVCNFLFRFTLSFHLLSYIFSINFTGYK